ncbi:MAG: hypothetical protein K2G72_05715, partial [Duncaniella sp.]|nr:hypothetical protein [Duncaniella sp.]
MKSQVILSAALMLASSVSASVIEKNDTTNVLGEVVVLETSAKAPVALLPLDVKIVGAEIIDNSTETNLLPVLQNR